MYRKNPQTKKNVIAILREKTRYNDAIITWHFKALRISFMLAYFDAHTSLKTLPCRMQSLPVKKSHKISELTLWLTNHTALYMQTFRVP